MVTNTFTIKDATAWMVAFRDEIAENQEYLTGLDAAIGDADHGANMERGTKAVVEKLCQANLTMFDAFFKAVGMALVSSVGGASGPLYGTFFLRFSTSAGTRESCDKAAMSAALAAGLQGIADRGKARLGDKTMFDALSPAVDAFDAAPGMSVAEAASAAAAAAAAARDGTAPLTALKGRASYLGVRSVGHIDPGAASSALLFDALAKACE
jgi:dihydroxyacetone kinase-like protein